MTRERIELNLTTLRRWHRALSAAHDKACRVHEEAHAMLGDDDDDATIIGDPIIELHAALSQVEALIARRERKDRP